MQVWKKRPVLKGGTILVTEVHLYNVGKDVMKKLPNCNMHDGASSIHTMFIKKQYFTAWRKVYLYPAVRGNFFNGIGATLDLFRLHEKYIIDKQKDKEVNLQELDLPFYVDPNSTNNPLVVKNEAAFARYILQVKAEDKDYAALLLKFNVERKICRRCSNETGIFCNQCKNWYCNTCLAAFGKCPGYIAGVKPCGNDVVVDENNIIKTSVKTEEELIHHDTPASISYIENPFYVVDCWNSAWRAYIVNKNFKYSVPKGFKSRTSKEELEACKPEGNFERLQKIGMLDAKHDMDTVEDKEGTGDSHDSIVDLGSSAQSDYNANDALDQYEENDFVVNDAQEAGNNGSRVIQQQYLQSQWTQENDVDDRRSYNTLSTRKILLRQDYPTREESQTILLNIKQNLLIHLVKRRAEKAGKKVIHRHT